MPRAVEPSREPDDYIDDLPLIDSEVIDAVTVASRPVSPRPSVKAACIRPATVVALLVLAAVFVAGWATAAVQYVWNKDYSTTEQATEPDPSPTVTVTKTVTALPESCERAIAAMSTYLDGAQAMSAANGKQVDIMRDAYQAILLKDWKALNDLTERQRALEVSLQPASEGLLLRLADVKKDLTRCQQEGR